MLKWTTPSEAQDDGHGHAGRRRFLKLETRENIALDKGVDGRIAGGTLEIHAADTSGGVRPDTGDKTETGVARARIFTKGFLDRGLHLAAIPAPAAVSMAIAADRAVARIVQTETIRPVTLDAGAKRRRGRRGSYYGHAVAPRPPSASFVVTTFSSARASRDA